MSGELDLTRIVRSWLQTDEHESADRVLGVVLGRLDTTPQRVPWWRAWRDAFMTSTLKLTAAAVAIVLVAGVGFAIFVSRPATMPGATQSTAPTIAPTAPATASPSAPPLEGRILFARQGGEFEEGRVFSLDANGEDDFLEEEACCLVGIPGGRSVLYGLIEGDYIIPTFVDETFYREELRWAELIEPGYPVSNLNLAPRAAKSGDQLIDNVYAMEGWDREDGSHAGVYLGTANGGRLVVGDFEQLTTAPAGFRDVPFSFSPDGTRLLYGQFEATIVGSAPDMIGDLYVVDVDGGVPHRVNPIGARVPFSDDYGAGASWSPDGSQIAFAGFSGPTVGESRVYVSESGGEGVAITDPGQYITSARWSPAGEWILFDKLAKSGATHDLYVVAPDGSGERNLTATYEGGTCCGQWSPDGQRIVALGSESSPTSNLTIFNLDGSEPVRITENAPITYLWYSWTP